MTAIPPPTTQRLLPDPPTSTTLPTRENRSRAISPLIWFWLAMGVAVNLTASPGTATLALAAVGMTHAAFAFLTHGGRRISPPGVYLLGMGLFGFFPAIYLVKYTNYPPFINLLLATNICYFSQILLYYIFWSPPPSAPEPTICHSDPGLMRRGMVAGLASAAMAIGLGYLGVHNQILESAAFTGIVLFAVSAFGRRNRFVPAAYLITAVAGAGYFLFVFQGFGRLTLGALGIAIMISLAHRWPGRTAKLALLAGLVPALAYLAQSRVAFTASLNPAQSSKVTGLESVISPMIRFAQLLDMESLGQIPHAWGSTFFTAAVAQVPRVVWPEKPDGFGTVLARLFQPRVALRGLSEAALFHGEWLFNFGFLGIIVMIPLVGLAVAWLDRRSVAAIATPALRARDLFKITALVLLTAGLVDLVWGGAFTYTARSGTRLLTLVALILLIRWSGRTKGRASHIPGKNRGAEPVSDLRTSDPDGPPSEGQPSEKQEPASGYASVPGPRPTGAAAP